MYESQIAEIKKMLISLYEGASGNLILKEGESKIHGYAISSEGLDDSGTTYCLAK